MRTIARPGALLIALAALTPFAGPASAAPAGAATVFTEGRWRALATTGEGVSARSAPAAVGLRGSAYVFGGAFDDFSTGQATFYNDLHRLDVGSRTWRRLTPAGLLPPARAFAASAAQPATDRIFVFGGSTFDVQGTEFQPFGDLWAYSTTANRWSPLPSATAAPSARSGASMWLAGSRLYLFGGIDATFTTLNDLWYYDLNRSQWTPVAVSGPVPPPRHVAQSGTAPVLGRFTLYGGEGLDETGFTALTDTWEFDLRRGQWREVTPATANIEPVRNYGAAALLGTGLYLHGGDVPGGADGCGAPFPQNATDELWRFDVVQHVWRRVHPAGAAPVRLKRHAAATVDGRIVVVAGWDFRCVGGTGPGQVWNLTTYTYTP